jgi:hypothetical protein
VAEQNGSSRTDRIEGALERAVALRQEYRELLVELQKRLDDPGKKMCGSGSEA